MMYDDDAHCVSAAQVLVLGGDGTVGWVLSCIDALQAEAAGDGGNPDKGVPKEQLLSEHWTPPPVAVLPLGTGAPPAASCPKKKLASHLLRLHLLAGNDLARVLNWGSGASAFAHRSLGAILHDVEHATVSLLDR